MATYKAEFLSHYYEKRMRPMAAYTMGWIYWWARAAAFAPGLANIAMSLPLTKKIGGIAPRRTMPRFARQTFREWFDNRSGPDSPPRLGMTPAAAARKRVMLWPDTFNNHFHPGTAIAAVEVLEAAGYEVVIPRRQLCCGRPLYDWGFIGMAKRLLRQTMRELSGEIASGTPIIGLEPSCVSVFRDELVNLFSGDDDAKRLSGQVVALSEFIANEKDFVLPKLKRKALVQAHCHHKAILRFDDEEALLRKIGLDLEHPDSGCCGMAGAFGFEEDKYEISMRVGERVLLPKVREAAPDTLIIADGFSCREQIEQTTNRKALHLAQVLQMARHDGQAPPPRVEETPPRRIGKALRAAALFAAGFVLLWRLVRKKRKTGKEDVA
jgi:Fe-S oxidoreductase